MLSLIPLKGTSFRLLLVICAISFLTSGAHAKDSESVGIRAGFALGPWISKFSQTDGTHEAKFVSAPSIGTGLTLGIQFAPIFIEYDLAWMISAYSQNPKSRDASYFSPLGFNLGLMLPILPLEPYVGVERASYKINGGVSPSFSGNILKLGLNLCFSVGGSDHGYVGLKGEFRRVFATGDERGDLPSTITTRADMYYIAMIFGYR